MSRLIDLPEGEFHLLRDIIHDRFGIYFKNDKLSFLRLRLTPRLEMLGMSSFRDYLSHIKYDAERDQELAKMISSLTNNETYFFREMPQLNAFQEFILPKCKEMKNPSKEGRLRVLSAGCSTGEEAYTLASIIYESGAFFWNWKVDVIGMDVDRQALAVARSGRYCQRSFRMMEDTNLKVLFSPDGNGCHLVKEGIARMVTFIEGNLTDPASWDGMEPFDVIFCRNVLIYFSEQMVRKAVSFFFTSLRDGGTLFLGHSETLTGIFEGFETVRFPGTLGYVKREK